MANELVFEPELQPAVITADFEGMKARLKEFLAQYDDLDEQKAAEMDIKFAKAGRAELNSMSKQLNDARKEIKRTYDAPLKAFEAEIKELDEMILTPARILDKAVKDKETAQKQARKESLEQIYLDFAPTLATVVPFDRIVEHQWLNKSFGEKKAEEALTEKTAIVAKDWRVLKETDLKCPEATEAEFFRTLSLQDALAYDKQQAEDQARVAALKKEVQANKAEPEEVNSYFLVFEATDSQWMAVKNALTIAEIHGKAMKATRKEVDSVYDEVKEALNSVKEVINDA